MCKSRYSAHWFHVVPDHCPNLIPNNIEREWFDERKNIVRRHYKNDPWKVDNVMDKANFTLNSTVVPLRVRYKSATLYHKSLIHMWKDWYNSYLQADFPFLMVRLEDLVYHPRSVLESICDCAGGVLAEHIMLSGDSAITQGDNIHGANRTGLVDAMNKHVRGDRTKGMTPEDIQYAREVLKESPMQLFSYKEPIMIT
jgi:hypothetical protein